MQIWSYTLILIGSLSTFIVIWLIRYFHEKVDYSSSLSPIITEEENSSVLHLDWKKLGKKKYVLVDQYFTANEAKDC